MGSIIRRRLITAGGLLLLIFCTSASAQALTFHNVKGKDGFVYIKGGFEVGDSKRFEQYIERSYTKPHTALLESPGGVSVEGMKLGLIFRKYGMATYVPANSDCASACVYAFIGGVVRSKAKAGRIGVHNGSASSSEEYIGRLREIIVDDELKLDVKLQLITLVVETHAARSVALLANYVQRMGVSMDVLFPSTDTWHVDIKWLSSEELKVYNVINSD